MLESIKKTIKLKKCKRIDNIFRVDSSLHMFAIFDNTIDTFKLVSSLKTHIKICGYIHYRNHHKTVRTILSDYFNAPYRTVKRVIMKSSFKNAKQSYTEMYNTIYEIVSGKQR